MLIVLTRKAANKRPTPNARKTMPACGIKFYKEQLSFIKSIITHQTSILIVTDMQRLVNVTLIDFKQYREFDVSDTLTEFQELDREYLDIEKKISDVIELLKNREKLYRQVELPYQDEYESIM